MANGYTSERRSRLEALAELLPHHGLVSRMVGNHEPVLWVWHPRTGRQTMIFAIPSHRGWTYLWSPGGQSDADQPELAAAALREILEKPQT
ncbi:hypothetical protein FH608_009245 [Nonomuraea phyllanthi]|uniref:Uncharacterized protein n=1 Tax=Nonomuraea phyllanthi TaxID=2219224 RepID=A0A5C4WSJ2_9ACTN|nr:hypothetical protein [Nonomuraea phyllanthi]KAB8195694.1 hypothetical protein FH608_009245 [Nonomuraea phyllanthi]QFY07136.1 hypothetical protein GBF35_10955 [Nonomuraea phyllanthi]